MRRIKDLSVFLIILLLFREGLTFFDASSEPLKKELSRGKFTILPSKVSSYRPSEIYRSRQAFIYKYLVRNFSIFRYPGIEMPDMLKFNCKLYTLWYEARNPTKIFWDSYPDLSPKKEKNGTTVQLTAEGHLFCRCKYHFDEKKEVLLEKKLNFFRCRNFLDIRFIAKDSDHFADPDPPDPHVFGPPG